MTLPNLASATADAPAPAPLLPSTAQPRAPSAGAAREANAVMMRALEALAVARLRVDELRETRRSVQLFGTRPRES